MPLDDETNEEFTRVYGEIRAHFTVTQTPEGGAPEEIRREWVGVALPVRAKYLGEEALKGSTYFDAIRATEIENTEPVTVVGVDARVALDDAGKEEVSDYWRPYTFATFVFRASEGVLAPIATNEEETSKTEGELTSEEAELIQERMNSPRENDLDLEDVMKEFGFKPKDFDTKELIERLRTRRPIEDKVMWDRGCNFGEAVFNMMGGTIDYEEAFQITLDDYVTLGDYTREELISFTNNPDFNRGVSDGMRSMADEKRHRD